MPRKPTEDQTRKETISFRVTVPFYDNAIEHVNASNEPNLSDYARNALIDRMKKEDENRNGDKAKLP